MHDNNSHSHCSYLQLQHQPPLEPHELGVARGESAEFFPHPRIRYQPQLASALHNKDLCLIRQRLDEDASTLDMSFMLAQRGRVVVDIPIPPKTCKLIIALLIAVRSYHFIIIVIEPVAASLLPSRAYYTMVAGSMLGGTSTFPTSLAHPTRAARSQKRCVALVCSAATPVPLPASTTLPASVTWKQCAWPRAFGADVDLGTFIAQGSFGRVYTGVLRNSSTPCAVKVLSKQHTKVQHEVELLQQLQGVPGVLELHGVYEDTDNVYLVTELCRGGTISDFLAAHGRMSEREAASVLSSLLTVLVACHQAGVVYSDIKPTNLLIRGTYPHRGATLEAVVGDYGLAQALAPGDTLSKPVGTPMYMAPELFMCSYDHAADMWGVGMLLYQMLVGRLPFFDTETTPSPMELAITLMAGELDLRAPELATASPEVVDLIAMLLNRDPAERPTAQHALAHPWFAKLSATKDWVLPEWSRRSIDVQLRSTFDEEE